MYRRADGVYLSVDTFYYTSVQEYKPYFQNITRTPQCHMYNLGVVEVVGSNPVTPTNISKRLSAIVESRFLVVKIF